jgi:hypothetical protein
MDFVNVLQPVGASLFVPLKRTDPVEEFQFAGMRKDPVEEPIMDKPPVFIEANTLEVSKSDLLTKCTIPVFAKDNEATISHNDFISSIEQVIGGYYPENHTDIRVSHPIKGRVPDAKHKSAKELLDAEKTVYYERVMFTIEVPTIFRDINGNHLSLTVGGVRGYHQENLYARRNMQKFKVFVGFRNRVCCNMCVSTDGVLDDIKVSSANELRRKTHELLVQFESAETLELYQRWANKRITAEQFAHFLGICRMLNHMPSNERKGYPELLFTDHQLNLMVDGYYNDKHFGRSFDGSIDMWRLYNLFTSANKQSYIDRFLDRGLNASMVVNNISSYLV